MKRFSKFFVTLGCLAIVGLIACQGRFLLLQPQTVKIDSIPEVKVDILFVLDISTSLREEIETVRDNIKELVDQLVASNANFRIAIISTVVRPQTDAVAGQHSGEFLHNNTKDGDGNDVSPPIISSDDLSAAEVETAFAASIDYILDTLADATDGKGCEAILESAYQALNPDNAVNQVENSNFLRDDAFLAIIGITDEDDTSIEEPVKVAQTDDLCSDFTSTTFAKDFTTADEYVSFFQGLKVVEITETNVFDPFASQSRLSISGIVTLEGDVENCANPVAIPEEESTEFVKVIQATDGFEGSICSDDYSDLLSNFGLTIALAASQIILPVPAVASSIEVTLNGVALDSSEFSYDPTVPAVSIPGASVNDTVVINYTPAPEEVEDSLVN